MKSPAVFLLLITLSCWQTARSQQAGSEPLSLQAVVELAKAQSIAARQARNTRDTRYWEWRSFQADLRPQLLLQGNLPDFTRSFQEVVQPDGTIEFQSVANNNSGLRLGLQQNIAATGGTVYASTSLQRFDDFDRKRTLYNGQPIAIGFSQPIFGFNPWKWDKQIEPLRLEESERQLFAEQEDIALRACELYFEFLLAQANLEMAQFNLASSDTIYDIALERQALGQISRNDLLQLKLGVLNARKDAAAARQDMAAARLRLQAFAGLDRAAITSLALPDDIPATTVTEEEALRQAWKNRPEVLGFQRRLLEAKREMARARGETGLDVQLDASFGLTNRSATAEGLLDQPQDQQLVAMQFTVPIVDWGRAKARRETASANKALTEATVDQERLNFEQEVLTQVALFNMLREQLIISREADEIGLERFRIAKERFLLGDLSITDLNLALQEKDRARRDYIIGLRDFWAAYYGLRLLTLYDFEQRQKIF